VIKHAATIGDHTTMTDTQVQQTDLSMTFMQLWVFFLHLRLFLLESWYYEQIPRHDNMD